MLENSLMSDAGGGHQENKTSVHHATIIISNKHTYRIFVSIPIGLTQETKTSPLAIYETTNAWDIWKTINTSSEKRYKSW